MKKFKYAILFVLLVISLGMCKNFNSVEALDNSQSYTIYNEQGDFLFEKEEVYIGDEFLNNNFEKYKIIEINDIKKIGTATFVEKIKTFKIEHNNTVQINSDKKTICLYMSHNDESYLPTDKTESVYGNGGILDVANTFCSELRKMGISTYLDTTLHIPHDSNAYSRSNITANKMIKNYSPSAIFDVHRDAASRSFYIKNIDGVEKCRIRMVIGKRNSNYQKNEQFALSLMAVANEKYPWLFSDIYYATGHYNQALSNKSILFEMGSHLTEKNLVQKSMKPLADVINTTLFNTTINTNTGELVIHDNSDVVLKENEVLINDALKTNEPIVKNKYTLIKIIAALITISLLFGGIYYFVKKGTFDNE